MLFQTNYRLANANSFLVLCLFGLLFISHDIIAQTPSRPFEYGTLPAGWQEDDDTDENNGFLMMEFEGDFSRSVLVSSNPQQASSCKKTVDKEEGGTVIVRQRVDVLDVQNYRSEFDKWWQESGECTNDDSETCVMNYIGEGKVNFNGFNAYKLSYQIARTYYKEYISCMIGMGNYNYSQDLPEPIKAIVIVDAYLIQVGEVQFEVMAAGSSKDDNVRAARMNEINEFLKTFKFFGAGGKDNPENPSNNNTGGEENTTTTTTTTTTNDDEISDDTLITVAVGTGAAAVVVAILKGLGVIGGKTSGGGSSSNKGNSSNNSKNTNTPNTPKGKNTKKEEEENIENEDKKEEEDENKEEEDENKEEEDEEKEEEEEKHEKKHKFMVHLNKNNFEMEVGDTDSLQVAVWRIEEDGNQYIEESASIQIKPVSAALQVLPASAYGQITAQLKLQSEPQKLESEIFILANVESKEIRTKATLKFKKKTSAYELVTTIMPPNKQDLVPNGKDTLYFYAQIVNKNNPDDKSLAQANQNIKIDKYGVGNDWLDMSEPIMKDGWKAISVQASHPAPHLIGTGNAPQQPESVSVKVSASINDQHFEKIVDFKLQKPSVLDVDRDNIYFPAVNEKSKITIEIKAFVEPSGGEKWKFTAEYEKGNPALTKLEVIPQGDALAIIKLSSPTFLIPEGKDHLYNKLIIKSTNPNRQTNERWVHVRLMKEGIFLVDGANKQGFLEVSGEDEDIKKPIFAVYVWDEKEKELIPDKDAVKHLDFEYMKANHEDKQAKNVLSVAMPKFKFQDILSEDRGLFYVQSTKEIPGDARKPVLFNLHLKTYSKINKKEYEVIIASLFVPKDLKFWSEDWKKEYEYCMTYIKKHVPDAYKQKVKDMVEERKMSLGAEGLYELRHKIHSFTYELILAQGAEGYVEAEKWYTAQIEWLEWCEWAGNLAFNVVSATLFGPYAPAISIAKSYGIGALQAVLEGKTLEDWFYETFTLHALFKAGEGRLIDVDRIKEVLKKRMDGDKKIIVAAWAAYISYHFAYNVFWEKKSVVESLKQVAREVRDELIVSFLVGRCKAEMVKNNHIEMPKEIKKLRDSIRQKPNGDFECDEAAVLEAMKDPQVMRTLKTENITPGLKLAFNNTRNNILVRHDVQLLGRLKENLAREGVNVRMDDLRIDDFRTPGTAPNPYAINTDRDYRVLRRMQTKDGQEIWMEVKKEKWVNDSLELFGEVTNKPAHISKEDWAKMHNMTMTDKAHIEASPDYSDQAIDPSTGKVTQIKPNIIDVEKGTSRLYDAEALGNMYHEKVMTNFRTPNLAEHKMASEALAQMKKGVHTLESVHGAYENKQNLPVRPIPPQIHKGMDVIKKYPADLNFTEDMAKKFKQEMNDAGIKGDNVKDVIEEFSQQMNVQFHALKPFDLNK
jgi:hypothetical protein